ncbi:MAG: MutS-related protein [Acidimicrobiales bacterium]
MGSVTPGDAGGIGDSGDGSAYDSGAALPAALPDDVADRQIGGFTSLLFMSVADQSRAEAAETPECFHDLNLDQIVEAVIAGREEYNLAPLFYFPLGDTASVNYRQEVMRDIEDADLRLHLMAFAGAMHTVRARRLRLGKLYYRLQKERWFVDTVEIYCGAVIRLVSDLEGHDLASRGLIAAREYLQRYVASNAFGSLLEDTRSILADLDDVKYALLVKGNRVTVFRHDFDVDYSEAVASTFEKFRNAGSEPVRADPPTSAEMNQVDAGVLERVAKLYPEVFARLGSYCTEHAGYLDQTVVAMDREVQFYLAYIEHIDYCRSGGLGFCYPEVCALDKDVHATEAFDLALAVSQLTHKAPIVCNDFFLGGGERVCVVSGPNQGGKTTFARMFGQLHYLASLGCPVPGKDARLFLFDQLFTHFEREEDLENLSGKLQDDLVRIHSILDQATSRSILVLNEIFASTTLQDAVFLGTRVLERIMELDALCVYVTFVEELASLSAKTVSMVSTVDPENPAVRTFKILRRPADGLSYALALAEMHDLTYELVKGRLAR